MVNQAVDERARESAKKAKQMSPSVQYAIVQVLPNIGNGAFWGFTDMKGVQEHLDAIKDSNGTIVARKLGNACLLEVNPNFLISSVSQIDPNAVTRKDAEVITQKRAEAQIAFEKFLISKGKKLDKGAQYEGTVGIYCVNDVNTINYKGTSFPAFRVDISTALNLLDKYGYQVKVGGSYVSARQAANSGQALWSSVVLAPTKTGLFIDIKCVNSPETIKVLEKQFKEQYGIK